MERAHATSLAHLECAVLIGSLCRLQKAAAAGGAGDRRMIALCAEALRASAGAFAHNPDPSGALRLSRVFRAMRSEPHEAALEEIARHPVAIPLHLLHGASAAHGGGRGKDASAMQARRDIQRDVIAVNGVEYLGSVAGYEGIVSSIASSLADIDSASFEAAETSTGAAPLAASGGGGERARLLAEGALRVCNRTVSGGDAYEAASKFLSPSTFGPSDPFLARLAAALGPGAREAAVSLPGLTLVADSAAAPPLQLAIDAGVFQFSATQAAPSNNADDTVSGDGSAPPPPFFMGVRFAVRATTVFRVFRADVDLGDMMAAIEAVEVHPPRKGAARVVAAVAAAPAGSSSSGGGDATWNWGDEANDGEASSAQSPPTTIRAAAAAAAAAVAVDSSSRSSLVSRGYFGRLRATYVRHLAAMPAFLGAAVKARRAGATAGDAAVAGSPEEDAEQRVMHRKLLRLARMQREADSRGRQLAKGDIASVVLGDGGDDASAEEEEVEPPGPFSRLFDAGDGGCVELLFEPLQGAAASA